jgi:hypothetical protein
MLVRSLAGRSSVKWHHLEDWTLHTPACLATAHLTMFQCVDAMVTPIPAHVWPGKCVSYVFPGCQILLLPALLGHSLFLWFVWQPGLPIYLCLQRSPQIFPMLFLLCDIFPNLLFLSLSWSSSWEIFFNCHSKRSLGSSNNLFLKFVHTLLLFFFSGATIHIRPWPLQYFTSRYPYPLPISSIILCSAAMSPSWCCLLTSVMVFPQIFFHGIFHPVLFWVF